MALENDLKPVLIVDDDEIMRMGLTDALMTCVQVVAEAATEEQALAAIETLACDTAIICDLSLTGGGREGMRILERALQLGFRQLILFTSTPEVVSVAWQVANPTVQLVKKGSLGNVIAVVMQWYTVVR